MLEKMSEKTECKADSIIVGIKIARENNRHANIEQMEEQIRLLKFQIKDIKNNRANIEQSFQDRTECASS